MSRIVFTRTIIAAILGAGLSTYAATTTAKPEAGSTAEKKKANWFSKLVCTSDQNKTEISESLNLLGESFPSNTLSAVV